MLLESCCYLDSITILGAGAMGLLAAPLGEPAPQGFLRLPRPFALEQAGHPNVFVQVRPMDTFAVPNEPPVVALLRRPMGEAGEPRDGRADGPAIREVHGERILANHNGPCSRVL